MVLPRSSCYRKNTVKNIGIICKNMLDCVGIATYSEIEWATWRTALLLVTDYMDTTGFVWEITNNLLFYKSTSIHINQNDINQTLILKLTPAKSTKIDAMLYYQNPYAQWIITEIVFLIWNFETHYNVHSCFCFSVPKLAGPHLLKYMIRIGHI